MADKELLSALMDGDTVDEALIDELTQDGESQDTWKNYHLISDVIKGEAPETANWNIAESVAAALESEPTYDMTPAPMVESQPTPAEARRQLPAWLNQFGQVAVAACVSMAVILGVQQYGGSDATDQGVDQLPVLQTIPLAGSVEPVSLTREKVSPQSQISNEAQLLEQRRRVNAMLQDHELQLRLTAAQAAENESESKPVVE